MHPALPHASEPAGYVLSVYLDVDGVLLPLPETGRAPGGAWPGGYAQFRYGSMPLPYAPELVDRLNALHRSGLVRLVWATSWEVSETDALAGMLGLESATWPSLSTDRPDGARWWKWQAVQRDHEQHPGPFFWVDDHLVRYPAARSWTESAGGVWVSPDPVAGLVPADMDRLEAAARAAAGA